MFAGGSNGEPNHWGGLNLGGHQGVEMVEKVGYFPSQLVLKDSFGMRSSTPGRRFYFDRILPTILSSSSYSAF